MRLFLKNNSSYIFIYFLGLVITIGYSNIKGFIGYSEIIYIIFFNTFILLSFFSFNYYKNKKLYKLLKDGVKAKNDVFMELDGSALSESISEIFKKQFELYEAEIQKHNKIHNEHLTFINQWVHQMKTPLSVIKLQLKEYEGEEKAESIEEEVNKLNKGLNMALNFARLDSFQKDFLVKEINLRGVVMEIVNKEKKSFIKNKIIPKVEIDKGITVYSDLKWLKVIIEQLISNGIKYSKHEGQELIIMAFKDNKKINLSISDNGIGIPKKDIKRVFDPFFTGENGRKYGESTGMGLYIAKEICKNLGHEINIDSSFNIGTKVTIMFR
ncbi:Signal transduction histidine kinase [Clostridium cavendishii DSM 21758]|uniref:histidine kinase n=1 Tax=Clostridium cavendishii DSM 21758 TaxID=1121302 RepID=A0A1M6HW45_9CLOT|nr:sensor histidine kinase [Clostridium cavendishii]SHJ26358.1 Signal transduction histidine kinase [Clostridium cavendishii DSM 21758]